MKKLIFILAAILSVTAASAYTPPDSCLKMIWPDDWDHLNQKGSINPDSVMVDICPESPTFGKWFAKRHWRIQFYNNCYPFDTVLDTNEIRSIDNISLKHPTIRQRFLELQNEFGNIYFMGLEKPVPDTMLFYNPVVRMFFEDYQDYKRIDSVFISTVDSLKAISYEFKAMQLTNVYDNPSNDNKFKIIKTIFTEDYLNIGQETATGNENIIIYSVNGSIILNTLYQESIDISGLPKGIYFAKYNDKFYRIIKF